MLTASLIRQIMADLRELLDIQFDVNEPTANRTSDGDLEGAASSNSGVIKRMWNLRHLRDPQAMAALAQQLNGRRPPQPVVPPQARGRPYPQFSNALRPFLGPPPVNRSPGRPIKIREPERKS